MNICETSNLTPQDLTALERSYVTPELAEQARIFRVDSHDGARLVGLDPYSSAPWFDGWSERAPRPQHGPARTTSPRGRLRDPPPLPRARSWLLDVGWRRHGLLSPT